MSSFAILTQLLNQDAGVRAFTDGTKVYPYMAPQAVKPDFIILNEVSATETKLLSSGDAEYFHDRMQIECLSDKATNAEAMGKAVRKALRGIIKRTIGDYTDIDVVFADLALSDFDDNRTMFRRVLHYRVHWRTVD